MDGRNRNKDRRLAELAGEGQGPQVVPSPEEKAKTPREKDPAVVAAEEALAKAKAAAREARKVQAQAKAKEPRPVCTSLKKDGNPCTAHAKEGQTTCVDHTPAWDRMTKDEQAQWLEMCRFTQPSDWANELGWHRARELAKGWRKEATPNAA